MTTIEPWQLFVGIALVLAGYLIGWVNILWLTLRHEKYCQQVNN